MEDFSQFICYELKMVTKKIERYLTKYLEDFGVNFHQSLILFTLLEKDGVTFSEISNRARIENSSLTTMADNLEKMGVVQRGFDKNNRRIVRLHLTEKGRKLATELFKSLVAFNQNLKGELGDKEVELRRGLELICDSMEKNNNCNF